MDPNGNEDIVAIGDLGSNKFNLVIYDRSTHHPKIIFEHDAKCMVGKGIKSNDPNPKLNEQGTELAEAEIKVWNEALIKHKPKHLMLVATAAIRVSYNNPLQTENVINFLSRLAAIIKKPIEAFTRASNELESLLLGYAILRLGHKNGFGIMTGGNSCEFVQIKNGLIINHATLPFGMNSLMESNDPVGDIRKALDSIPWFRDSQSTPRHRKNHLFLVGGDPRAFGRVMANSIYRTPLCAKLPYDGHSFAADDEFFENLKITAKLGFDQIFENYAGVNPQNLKVPNKNTSRSFMNIQTRIFGRKAIVAEVKQDALYDEYEKLKDKIGGRVATFRMLAAIICEADKRIHPHAINYSSVTMRDAVLSYSGLG